MSTQIYKYKVRLFNHRCIVCNHRIIYALHRCKVEYTGWINCNRQSKLARRNAWKKVVTENFKTAIGYEVYKIDSTMQKYIKTNEVVQSHNLFDLVDCLHNDDAYMYSMDI